MNEEYIHVFKRNMGTINVSLEHILNSDSTSEEQTKGYFELIRKVVDHCEKLALNKIIEE